MKEEIGGTIKKQTLRKKRGKEERIEDRKR